MILILVDLTLVLIADHVLAAPAYFRGRRWLTLRRSCRLQTNLTIQWGGERILPAMYWSFHGLSAGANIVLADRWAIWWASWDQRLDNSIIVWGSAASAFAALWRSWCLHPTVLDFAMQFWRNRICWHLDVARHRAVCVDSIWPDCLFQALFEMDQRRLVLTILLWLLRSIRGYLKLLLRLFLCRLWAFDREVNIEDEGHNCDSNAPIL